MDSERQIEEAVARCVSTIVYYQKADPSERHSHHMHREIQALALSLRNLGVSPAAIEEQLVRPVEAEILARFGPVSGRLVVSEFTRALGFVAPSPVAATG